MKPFLLAAGLFVLASPVVAAVPPNVVLMLADDMGMGDTSAYRDFTGNAAEVQIRTPAMERLARMGVRFTDAHTPASRCTTTRYALLTGRYAWRSRMKYWVLFGAQGDPLIEPGRPTIATLLREHDYRTAMVGKWHVGLRYRRSDGTPAAGWDDADLRQPLFDSPLDHGFDACWFTSRSHGTSGPNTGTRGGGKRNGPMQSVGPGHLHGRTAIAATDDGKRLIADGERAYVLNELGGRHSDHAMAFLTEHLADPETRTRPFFLYYPSNSNHGPHTPDTHVGETPVKGAGRTVSGEPTNTRGNYVYENDVALARLIDHLASTDDPRVPGAKLLANTIVIFTSDNGAERDDDVATGPFRSNKGSCYEGGHRVPFLVAWPAGGVGDGDDTTPGRTSDALIGLHDVYATLADIVGAPTTDLRAGAIGGEDSTSVLAAWRGEALPSRPMFFHDHKQAKGDNAVAALRLDDPVVDGKKVAGQWKCLFDASLLRTGTATPFELYDLASDQREERNRLDEPGLAPLVAHLRTVAVLERTAGGHSLGDVASAERVRFDWSAEPREGAGEKVVGLAGRFAPSAMTEVSIPHRLTNGGNLTLTITAHGRTPTTDTTFSRGDAGLGIAGGTSDRCDDGESFSVWFDRDVIVESAGIVAGDGACGGFCTVGDRDPLAIYCVDADNDSQDQRGLLSDLGVLRAGQRLSFESAPHHGSETPGSWRLRELTVRALDPHPSILRGLAKAEEWPELSASMGRASRSASAVRIDLPDGGEGTLTLPRLNNLVLAAYRTTSTRKPLVQKQTPTTWSVALGPAQPGDDALVIETLGRPRLATKPWVVEQGEDDIARLPAWHAMVTGEKLQFEPQPWKNTVGYWVNADDHAEWAIRVDPGRYRVRILQGCGKGQGGSLARIAVGEAAVDFEVVETGHFQNFRWRTVGEIDFPGGEQRLSLRAVKKARNAVMDCRRIELVPVESE